MRRFILVGASLLAAVVLGGCGGEGGSERPSDRSDDQPLGSTNPSSICVPVLRSDSLTYQGFFLSNRSSSAIDLERVRLVGARGVRLGMVGISEIPPDEDGVLTVIGYDYTYPPTSSEVPAASFVPDGVRTIPGARLPRFSEDRAWGLTLELIPTSRERVTFGDIEVDYKDRNGKRWTWEARQETELVPVDSTCPKREGEN